MYGNSGSITTTGIPSSLGLSTDGILYSGSGLALVAVTGDPGDDGGWELTGIGAFPTTIGVKIWVKVPRGAYGTMTNEPVYSGVQDQGAVCWSTTGSTIKFVIPPLPSGGPYDIYLETTDEALTYTAVDMITVVHRTHTTCKYQLRAAWPPPRDVGSYDIDGEAYDG